MARTATPSSSAARRRAVAATATLLLALAGCAAPAAGSDAEGLMGTEWRLQAVGEAPALPGVEATLGFPEPGRTAGRASCNRFFGRVHADAGRIRFDQLGATRMACPGPIDEQERRVLRALGAAQRYERNGDTLVIHAPGADTLHYVRARWP
jgi:heat shock protein HslJ